MGGVGTSIYFIPSEDEYPLYFTYRLYFPYTNNIIEPYYSKGAPLPNSRAQLVYSLKLSINLYLGPL